MNNTTKLPFLDLQLEIFCLYLTFHIKYKYNDDFIMNKDFDCSVDNQIILLQFSSFSENEKFIIKIINDLYTLTIPETYNLLLLENILKKVKNQYKSFNLNNSLDTSIYFLKLLLDK